VFLDYTGQTTRRWLRVFGYTRSAIISAAAMVAGVLLSIPLIGIYVRQGLRLSTPVEPANHMAVTGLLFLIWGFMHFTFTLSLHAAATHLKRAQP
jgi:hypothetical protein